MSGPMTAELMFSLGNYVCKALESILGNLECFSLSTVDFLQHRRQVI